MVSTDNTDTNDASKLDFMDRRCTYKALWKVEGVHRV